MKLFKRITAAVLGLCMVSGLYACDKSAAESLDIEEPVTITVWYEDARYTDYIAKVSESFSKENSLVTINYEHITEDNYVEYIYNESVHGENAPDIFLMNTDNLEKASLMGLIMENNSYAQYYTEDNYSRTALKAASYKGKLYGYPMSFNVAFLLYNADAASPVSNFTELADYCNSYEVNDSNQNITQLVLWNPSDMFINYGFSCESINMGGESGDDSSQLSVNKDMLTKGMENFIKQKDVFGISRTAYATEDIMQQFADGKVAYTITDANHLKTVTDSAINYGICDIPDFENDIVTGSMSENVCAFVNPYAGQLKAAKAVAHALSYDYAESLYELSGTVSSRVIKGRDESYDSRFGKLYEIYDNSSVKAKFMGSVYFYTKYDIMIHQIWDGEDFNTSIDSFVNEIQNRK